MWVGLISLSLFNRAGKFLICICGESKYSALGRNLMFLTATSLNSSTTRKWILNDWRHSEPHMQKNTDWAGVCRSSKVTAQVIKDAALYAIFPVLVSFLQSVGVWSHSWFRAREGGWVCVRACVGCSCILVWILSSYGLFNQRDLEYPSINTFFSPEKLMAAEKSGVVERVESTAITVSFCGWLNYNLWFINSSWHCQWRRGKRCHFDNSEIWKSALSPQIWSLPQSSCIQIKWSAQFYIQAFRCCNTWHLSIYRWNSNRLRPQWLVDLMIDIKLKSK